MMKKIVFLLCLVIVGVSVNAQTKSYQQQSIEQMKFNESLTTLYVHVVGLEPIDGGQVQLRALIGENKQFFIHDKSEYEILSDISSDISIYPTLADAFDFLSDRGYKIEQFSTVVVNDLIRYDIILSKTTMNN
jgi:hypothetical protein